MNENTDHAWAWGLVRSLVEFCHRNRVLIPQPIRLLSCDGGREVLVDSVKRHAEDGSLVVTWRRPGDGTAIRSRFTTAST